MKTPEKVVSHIVDWLNDYLKKSKMNGFVVGVSGGIDSAVTSTLCSLTNAPVLCLEMEIHQQPKPSFKSQTSHRLVGKKV